MQTVQPAVDAMLTALMTIGRIMRHRHSDDAVDPGTFWLLKTVSHRGPLRVTELAAATSLDTSTVSRHVAQLQRNGLVERSPDPGDRRAQLVGISAEGQLQLDQAFRRRRELLAATLAGWEPSDIAEFERLLGKLVNGINSEASQENE